MSGMRKDLRNQAQSRAISMHLGGVNEVDGASKYSQGKTSVLATVVGPVVPKFARHENSEKCTVEIEVNYASNLENLNNNGNNISEIAISDFLKSSILPAIQSELFPRKLIVIQVLILQNEGSIFSVALNACVLALLDAAIPMYYYMTCVQIAVISNELFVDPVEEEEKNAEGNLTICIKGSQMAPDEENAENIELMGEKEDKILSMEFSGVVQSNLIEPLVEAACKYSKALSATIRETIATKVSTTAIY